MGTKHVPSLSEHASTQSLSTSNRKYWILVKQASVIAACGKAVNIEESGELSKAISESDVKAVATDKLPPFR